MIRQCSQLADPDRDPVGASTFGAVVEGGAILTDTVFDLQGVGQYALGVPPVPATTMFSAFFIVLLNAIVDIV
jgi:peptide/nickel transport system permease protein